MSSFMQADIFFFITSIAVVAMTIVMIIMGILMIKILRRVNNISETIDEEVQAIKQDIDDLRSGVRDRMEKATHSPLVNFFGSVLAQVHKFTGGTKKNTRRRSTKKK